jgi:rhodanese-related sulfurtransferase
LTTIQSGNTPAENLHFPIMEVKRISPQETKALLDSGQGYIYLDVRTIPEFDAGHVPGAKNIPFLEPGPMGMAANPHFVEVVDKHFPKDAKLICGCQKGHRSLRAAQALQGAGFTSVVDMRGGFGGETDYQGCIVNPGWATSGLPVVTDSVASDRYASLKAILPR